MQIAFHESELRERAKRLGAMWRPGQKLWELTWGDAKTIRPTTDIVSDLVARGEVELGMVVITQIITAPGVELVGPLPAELQNYLVFTAGVCANSKATDAARALIKFLSGPTAIPVIKSHGMEPE